MPKYLLNEKTLCINYEDTLKMEFPLTCYLNAIT